MLKLNSCFFGLNKRREVENKMVEAILENATALFLEGKYDESLLQFDLALKECPKEQQSIVHANRGAAMMSVGDVEGAVSAFNQALEIDPNHLESLHNKGVALVELQDFERALECFSKVCEQSPEFYAGLCGKSETLANLGRYEESLQVATKACQVEPSTYQAFTDKAFAELKLKKFQASFESYEQSMKLGDDSAETKRLCSIALSQYALDEEEAGSKQKAVDLLTKSCELFPNPQNFHNKGIVLLSLNKPGDALQSFHDAVKTDDSYFESHAALGALFAQQDKLKDSLTHLEKACDIEPKSIETRYNLGVVRIKCGDINGARREWMKVLEIEPGEPHATEALRILDAALAEATAKGSDGKAETQAAARKISDISAITQQAPPAAPASSKPTSSEPPHRLVIGADGKGTGLTSGEADKLLQTLDKLDAALGPDPSTSNTTAAGTRRKSVLERTAQIPAQDQQRSYVRDVSAAPALRKAAPRDNFGGLEAKLTSALSKLQVEPDLVERRKSYTIGPRVPGTILPERPKVEYKQPSEECQFPYSELKNKCPAGIDPSRKEEYLSPEEFKKVFGKTKEEFQAFPAWKKIREKKRLGLF